MLNKQERLLEIVDSKITAYFLSRLYEVTKDESFFQGAAGIGLWLLKLNAFENGRSPHILFPDRFRL